jgi:hypothetical protein
VASTPKKGIDKLKTTYVDAGMRKMLVDFMKKNDVTCRLTLRLNVGLKYENFRLKLGLDTK